MLTSTGRPRWCRRASEAPGYLIDEPGDALAPTPVVALSRAAAAHRARFRSRVTADGALVRLNRTDGLTRPAVTETALLQPGVGDLLLRLLS